MQRLAMEQAGAAGATDGSGDWLGRWPRGSQDDGLGRCLGGWLGRWLGGWLGGWPPEMRTISAYDFFLIMSQLISPKKSSAKIIRKIVRKIVREIVRTTRKNCLRVSAETLGEIVRGSPLRRSCGGLEAQAQGCPNGTQAPTART